VKVRAVTVGTPLTPWPGAGAHASAVRQAGRLAGAVREALVAAGIEVQTVRLATPRLDAVLAGGQGASANPEVVALARSLEGQAAGAGFDHLALGAIDTLSGEEVAWRPLAESLPEVIGATERVFCTVEVAGNDKGAGINLLATRVCGAIVAAIARQGADGFGNLRFAALANCPPHIPFFPAAYHDGRQGLTVGLALEAADLAVEALDAAGSLAQAEARLVDSLRAEVLRLHALVAPVAGATAGATFCGVDLSLAPFPSAGCSIGGALERLGLPAFGAHGTLFLASMLTTCLRRVATATRGAWCGFSGLMLPVLEDSVLAARAAEGTFGVDSLLLYSAVCGLGLDTVPLPGDTAPDELGAIILDMATLAVRLDKPLTARLFPVPGKRAGDPVSWDFPYFAPSRVLPVRGMAPGGLLAQAERYPASLRSGFRVRRSEFRVDR
jgi:uncharacterized protein (UPF0210 family)